MQPRSAATLASLGLFLIALLPRALGLGVFATADEAKWVYRSAQFLGALLRGDLAGTVVNLTPGVTTTWLGSLGLAAYYALHRAELGTSFGDWLASLPEFRAALDVLVAVRWPMVLLSSAGVVAFYLLARRLTTEWAARLLALLLALDAHSLALSRVLGHDAPVGLFVGLALFAFLLAVPRYRDGAPSEKSLKWTWLVTSAVLAGLALLSKSPAFFLVPFVGLITLVEAWRQGAPLRIWLLQLVVWGLTAWVVFALVWPAGWVEPAGAPYSVVQNALASATDTVEADAEGYWQVPDLGPLYYLVNGAFKVSPLATLGLFAWAWLVLTRRRRPSSDEWWFLAFVVFFTVLMTLGGKRSNRYILPVWPALYMLAALGLAQILGMIGLPAGPSGSRVAGPGRRVLVWVGLLLLLSAPALTTFPYYLPYFNPLLGGALTAPHLVKIGWGEGLDKVGAWIEGQADASALRVGSFYASALSPFFSGNIAEVTSGGLDYVVLYRKQAQGGYPSPTILRYFEGEQPLATVRLSGIDYAWIFPGPAMQAALANEPAFDIGILPKPLAFRPSRPYLPIGEEVAVEVLWLADDELPSQPSQLALQPVDDLTRRPGERSSQALAESRSVLERRADGLVISRHELRIPPDLPRGTYALLVDGRPLGAVEARRFALPPLDARLDANFGGQVRLVGYAFDEPTGTLRLAWQAAPRAWNDYSVFVHVVDAAGRRLAGEDSQTPVPTSQWARGEVVIDERVVPIPDELAEGELRLTVGLYRADTGERLPVLASSGKRLSDSVSLPIDLAPDVRP